MAKQKTSTSDLEKKQRVQETKVAQTTSGPGETSVPADKKSTQSDSSSRVSEKENEPGDLNEV